MSENRPQMTVQSAVEVVAAVVDVEQGEKVLRNPLFSPSLNAAGHYLNAPSALIPEVGDRDDAEEDGTNFTLRIVRYAGMHPLPGDERWGYPSGRS